MVACQVERSVFLFFLLECRIKMVDLKRQTQRTTSGIKQWSVHEMTATMLFTV